MVHQNLARESDFFGNTFWVRLHPTNEIFSSIADRSMTRWLKQKMWVFDIISYLAGTSREFVTLLASLNLAKEPFLGNYLTDWKHMSRIVDPWCQQRNQSEAIATNCELVWRTHGFPKIWTTGNDSGAHTEDPRTKNEAATMIKCSVFRWSIWIIFLVYLAKTIFLQLY